MKRSMLLVRLLTASSLVAGSLVATGSPVSAAIDCRRGTQMDIGYTIKQDGKIKGSASYTSCSNRPITRAEIWIRRGGGRLFATKVEIKNIATPSQREFSPKDLWCNGKARATFDTFVVFYHPGGGKTELNSNDIRVPCD